MTQRAFAAGVIAGGLLCSPGSTHAGTAPASMPGDSITVERIFGEHSLLATLPSQIQWRGSSGVSFIRTLAGPLEGVTQHALVVRDVPSGEEHILCVADTVEVPADLRSGAGDVFSIGGHAWSRSGKRAVLAAHDELFVLDATSGRIDRLTRTRGAERDPTFSPDGRLLAFSRGNDLYTIDAETGEEIRHTTTGCDTIYNGILDWVYMEEFFTRGDTRAYWWSPDGKRLAFLELTEAGVPAYPIVDQIPVDATYRLQRYPKPGDPNPIVRVGVVDARGGPVTWSDVDTSDDSYVARVYWLGDGRAVAVEKLNRAQDRLTLFFVDPATGRGEVIMEESSPTWVNVSYLRHYYARKRQFLWGSERDGHMHLYLYNLDGSQLRHVTSGEWETFELAGVDEKKGHVYFTANASSPLERHLYRVNDNGKDMQQISTEEGTHEVTMSPDFKYFIDRYSSHARPQRVSVHNVAGKRLFDLGDKLSPELAAAGYPVPEFFTIQHEGRTYHCRMFKPADFDRSRRYPVLVYVYGGPHTQVVRKVWSRHDLWHGYMASRGYLVFSMDNRGSEGRGKAWEEPILGRMGQVELEDQLAGIDYLRKQPYVDAERIGIWGWSYGGYMTLTAMFNAPDVFRAGAAVAPVADWRLYDSIYTERYMKFPDENQTGYDASAPLEHVDGLRGSLLVAHGDADDNVHMQNTIALIQELIAAGKDFDLMLYPQKEHAIRGSAARTHLYRKLTRFFDRYLKGPARAPTPVP